MSIPEETLLIKSRLNHHKNSAEPTASYLGTRYRPDIDGLRALAVLSVIIFHAFPQILPGGFVGVDVFFVISGYLISGIILQNLHNKSFSFTEFYARRIRRIFPALIVLLATCYSFGWLVLYPRDYADLGQHVLAGAAFVDNFLLWSQQVDLGLGYFTPLYQSNLLLHIWSLSVEEQFYIFWPLILFIAWRYRIVFFAICFLATCSFLFNLYLVQLNKVSAFYFPHSRFWEMMAGGMVAWITLRKPILLQQFRTYLPKSILYFFGILAPLSGLIIWGACNIWMSENLNFPGIWAVFPVLAGVIVIAAGPSNWINKHILSNRMLVWIGLISYPLYLWHWPLLQFAYAFYPSYGNEVAFGAIILSFLFSWLTYKFIEQPIRFGRKYLKVKMLGLATAMITIGSLGFLTYKGSDYGMAFRYPLEIVKFFLYDPKSSIDAYRMGSCFLRIGQSFKDYSECKIEQSPDIKQSILLWGDSHAAHLYPGYKARYGNKYQIIQRTMTACLPFIESTKSFDSCKNINKKIASYIKMTRPTRIVLAFRWSNINDETIIMADLERTILELKQLNIPIDLVGPVPGWMRPLSRILYEYSKQQKPPSIPYRLTGPLNMYLFEVDDILKAKSKEWKINYLSPIGILCNEEGCLTRVGDTADSITAWDPRHLTTKASEYLVSKFPDY